MALDHIPEIQVEVVLGVEHERLREAQRLLADVRGLHPSERRIVLGEEPLLKVSLVLQLGQDAADLRHPASGVEERREEIGGERAESVEMPASDLLESLHAVHPVVLDLDVARIALLTYHGCVDELGDRVRCGILGVGRIGEDVLLRYGLIAPHDPQDVLRGLAERPGLGRPVQGGRLRGCVSDVRGHQGGLDRTRPVQLLLQGGTVLDADDELLIAPDISSDPQQVGGIHDAIGLGYALPPDRQGQQQLLGDRPGLEPALGIESVDEVVSVRSEDLRHGFVQIGSVLGEDLADADDLHALLPVEAHHPVYRVQGLRQEVGRIQIHAAYVDDSGHLPHLYGAHDGIASDDGVDPLVAVAGGDLRPLRSDVRIAQGEDPQREVLLGDIRHQRYLVGHDQHGGLALADQDGLGAHIRCQLLRLVRGEAGDESHGSRRNGAVSADGRPGELGGGILAGVPRLVQAIGVLGPPVLLGVEGAYDLQGPVDPHDRLLGGLLLHARGGDYLPEGRMPEAFDGLDYALVPGLRLVVPEGRETVAVLLQHESDPSSDESAQEDLAGAPHLLPLAEVEALHPLLDIQLAPGGAVELEVLADGGEPLALGEPVALHGLVVEDVVLPGLETHVVQLQHVLVALGDQEPALDDLLLGAERLEGRPGIGFLQGERVCYLLQGGGREALQVSQDYAVDRLGAVHLGILRPGEEPPVVAGDARPGYEIHGLQLPDGPERLVLAYLQIRGDLRERGPVAHVREDGLVRLVELPVLARHSTGPPMLS